MTDIQTALDPALVMGLAEKGMLSGLYARLKPNEIAIHAPRGQRSFAQIHANANRLAAVLRRAGLRPGDHLAMLCPNTPEFIEVLAATQRSGFRLTPINWHLSPPEVAYIVADCTAKAFIAHADFAAAAAEAVNDTVACRLAIGGEIEGFCPTPRPWPARAPLIPPSRSMAAP